jgi:hypothetical protein
VHLKFGTPDANGVGCGGGGNGLPASNGPVPCANLLGDVNSEAEGRDAGVGGSSPPGVGGRESFGGSLHSLPLASAPCPAGSPSSSGSASTTSLFEGTKASSRPPPCILVRRLCDGREANS